jgi:uncharacterized protein YgfB (UPF0149 family)
MPEDHMMEDQPQDFDDYANHLLEQGVQESPARVHGGICAVLVAAGDRQPDRCLELLDQALDIDFHGELVEASLQLIAATELAMANEDYEFHLFLPDDETDVRLRVQALADWCSGFMAAYAVAAPEDVSLAQGVAEILKDIAAISSAGFDDGANEEEAENSYFEITEYLRFAVLNLHRDTLEREDPAP